MSGKTIRRLHMYLGLSLGLLLFIIGLSGAALTFYIDIDKLLNPQIKSVSQTSPPNWDQALQTLRLEYQDKQGPWRFEVRPEQDMIPARYYDPVETKGQDFAPMMVWLSHDGQTILRRDFWGDYLMTWIYNLHYSLLSGKTGTAILGYIGLVSLILLISGLVSWWPKTGHWLKALKFKPRNNLTGLLYDWHKLIALVSFIPLLIIFVTGIMLALPNESRALLKLSVGEVKTFDKTTLTNHELSNNISISEALASAKPKVQQAQLAWIETPAIQGGFYYFRIQQAGDPSRRFPRSYIEINAQNGELTRFFDAQQQTTSTSIMNWLHPLHEGNLSGLLNDSSLAKILSLLIRIIWLFAGLALAALFVTGFARWYIRMQKRKA